MVQNNNGFFHPDNLIAKEEFLKWIAGGLGEQVRNWPTTKIWEAFKDHGWKNNEAVSAALLVLGKSKTNFEYTIESKDLSEIYRVLRYAENNEGHNETILFSFFHDSRLHERINPYFFSLLGEVDRLYRHTKNIYNSLLLNTSNKHLFLSFNRCRRALSIIASAVKLAFAVYVQGCKPSLLDGRRCGSFCNEKCEKLINDISITSIESTIDGIVILCLLFTMQPMDGGYTYGVYDMFTCLARFSDLLLEINKVRHTKQKKLRLIRDRVRIIKKHFDVEIPSQIMMINGSHLHFFISGIVGRKLPENIKNIIVGYLQSDAGSTDYTSIPKRGRIQEFSCMFPQRENKKAKLNN